jgi:hypothetical protein
MFIPESAPFFEDAWAARFPATGVAGGAMGAQIITVFGF